MRDAEPFSSRFALYGGRLLPVRRNARRTTRQGRALMHLLLDAAVTLA